MSLKAYQAPPLPGGGLTGAHVTLRRLAEADAGAMWDATAGHDALWRFLPIEAPQTEAEFAAHIAALCARPNDVAICIERDRRPLGHFLFMRLNRPNGVAEIGYVLLAPELQKTTAATEAFHLAIAHLFELGYRRVEWKCDAANLASRRAAQRLGFSFEGVFRQHMIVKGRNRDTAWFAMTDRDWPRIGAAHRAWLETEAGRLSAVTRALIVAADPAL